jgi:hypothetical protein
MTLPRRPGSEPPRRPAVPGKPPTGRAQAKPATARAGAPAARSAPGRAPAAPPKKNNMPLILGCAGGGVLLLIILVVMMSGEEPRAKAGGGDKSKAVKEDAPKRPAPDVSGLEATGKQRCEDGLKLVESRATPDSGAPKERVRDDLEKGLLLLKEGLETYKKAADLAGKKYDLGKYTRAQNVAISLFCTDLEKEGQASCDKGLALIKSTAGLLTGRELSDDEKTKLKGDLSQGKSLISAGMELLSRSERVSGRTFDQGAYQEALLIARKKLPELQ